MEQDNANEIIQPTNPWWKRRKVVWIGSISLVALIIIVAVSVGVTTGRRSRHIWNELRVGDSPYDSDARFVKLTGTWNDRIVVAGFDGDTSVIESYKKDNKDYDFVNGFVVDGIVSGMAVSKFGNILALAIEQPFQFLVYERSEENWLLVGQPIELEQLGLVTSKYSHPTVMLSDSGDILALGLQGEEAGIYVLEKNADGNVGGQWSLKGQPLLNTNQQDHGKFATFSDMSGDGMVLAVASETNKVSLYRYGGLKYDLYASYEESPRVGQGSLALSDDGSVLSVGSYQGYKQSMGQLHVVNDQWHWFIDESNHEGAEVDLFRTSIETALSEDGEVVVIGRYPLRTEGQDEQVATVQVYEFDPISNEWTSRGPPFGQQTSSSRRGSVDLSKDGLLLAAVMDGNVFTYEYGGTK